MPVRRGWLLCWAVFTLWPLLPALLGILLATLLGCTVNLNALEPCSVNGNDWVRGPAAGKTDAPARHTRKRPPRRMGAFLCRVQTPKNS